MKKIKNRKAFMLMELIVVVAVIAILMAIIIPAAQKVLVSARKAKASTSMRQIAEAYSRYYNEHSIIPAATSAADMALKLAQAGEINNANAFIFPGDKAAAEVLAQEIYPLDANKYPWEAGKPLSVVLICNIMAGLAPEMVPVAYSRGLKDDGTWDATNGVYGTEGGFIAFLDGTVTWFTNLSEKKIPLGGSTGSGFDFGMPTILSEIGATALDGNVPAAAS
ncbi:MAG: hypothetical protein LBN94_00010 [Puniceicoccales bacterium]|jgi:Tfp pilus assembly protein PilE|nr:hypothetical protein [Puniceicoccales bacterium]